MWLLFTTSLANPLVDALDDEWSRATRLQLPDAPPIYSLRYQLATVEQLEVVAAFGSLLETDAHPYNAVGIELRVGSPAFDNTGFGGWENGFTSARLAQRPGYHDTRQVLWRATDQAYKQAVEQFARKSAQATLPDDHPGDYDPGEPIHKLSDDGLKLPELDAMESLAKTLSNTFLPAGPDLLRGEVHIGVETGSIWLVDDETRVRRPMSEASIRMLATARTKDGETLTDQRLFIARTTDGWPPQAQLTAAVTELHEGLAARLTAPPLVEEYVGPIVFEDDAARDLFRYQLLPQLQGTPTELPYETWLGDFGGSGGSSVRVGRRVLPEGYSVIDDPLADLFHPAGFEVDSEGTLAERVELVDDGIVRDLMMSRVPRKGLRPNGHARGFLGARATGQATLARVEAPKPKPTKRLYKQAMKLSSSYGLDHFFIIRRLQEDRIRAIDAPDSVLDGGPGLPMPVEVIRRFHDGREEVVRGAEFADVQRFVLRDIAMAGPSHTTSWLAPFFGDESQAAPIEGMPVRLTVPDVLIREIEIIPSGRNPRDQPILEMPLVQP